MIRLYKTSWIGSLLQGILLRGSMPVAFIEISSVRVASANFGSHLGVFGDTVPYSGDSTSKLRD